MPAIADRPAVPTATEHPPDLDRAERTARELLARCGIAGPPSWDDMAAMAADSGVADVLRSRLVGRVRGFYVKLNDGPVIVMQRRLRKTGVLARRVLAHELGHHVLGHGRSLLDRSREEAEAEAFAAALAAGLPVA